MLIELNAEEPLKWFLMRWISLINYDFTTDESEKQESIFGWKNK